MSDQSNTIKKIIKIILVLIIICVAFMFYFKQHLGLASLPKPVQINTENQPTIGNPEAEIHFASFEDLKCVNCARFNNNLFPEIKKEYLDTNKAKYTMINLAFIRGSLPAANAARCVYTQNKKLFFPFVEYIYSHQPPESEDWANIPKLIDFASKINGVNINDFADCLVKAPYNQLINDNLKIAATVMKNQVATPSLFINGIKVMPLNKAQIEKVINAVN